MNTSLAYLKPWPENVLRYFLLLAERLTMGEKCLIS